MRIGPNSKTYYRSGGTYGSPTFTECTNINDFNLQSSWEKGPANSRGSRVNKSVKTSFNITASGTMKVRPGDADYEAFMDALNSDNVLDLLVLDGAKDEDSAHLPKRGRASATRWRQAILNLLVRSRWPD